MNLLSCNHFSDARTSLFCLQVILFRENNQTSFSKINNVVSFYAVQVSFKKIFYICAQEPDEMFWARLKEKTFAFVGKRLEHLESREILCVQCPKFLIVSAVPGFETLRKWILCLYNNVIICLYAATSQSINDRRELKLRLYTKQLALIRVLIVH